MISNRNAEIWRHGRNQWELMAKYLLLKENIQT